MNFIVVSFYTENTPYEEIINKYLIASLKNFPDIKSRIFKVPTKHNWTRNVGMKPEIIEEALNLYPYHNIVFIDADATIEIYPLLFNHIPNTYDIAVHYLDWATWYGRPEETRQELLSGTLFFSNTDKVKSLVRHWKQDCDTHNLPDARALEDIIQQNKGEVNVCPLPLSYCYIDSLPNGDLPLVKIDYPVIKHYQASRTVKRFIN